MKQSVVSVIITTKNSAEILKVLLGSIKRQTYKDIEIIVVDNASVDDTKNVARCYTYAVYNKGPERSAQRNFGASKARGTYLFFLDADMELTKKVIEDCIKAANEGFKAIIIPERTVGKGFIQDIRRFEREMYMHDPSVEVARFFDQKVFNKFGGYDLELTGPEDYDLPYRISKKYSIGRVREYILHHEEELTLFELLRKKYYYASRGALYASKHPELISLQGTILFRKVYLDNWKKFLLHPFTGFAFILVRVLETVWAVSGFISVVGPIGFSKVFLRMIKK